MAAQDYDTLHYPSFTHPETHPVFLHTLGHLLGQSPAPLAGAIVVEIGTSNGSNLIPMAMAYPQTSFIGVDPAAGRIKEGAQRIKAAGLKNITLLAMGVEDLDLEEGSVDYILVHGVMAWVSEEIQDIILRFIQRALSPKGIAYVSYNTRPGWSDLMGVSAYLRSLNSSQSPEKWCEDAEELLKCLIRDRQVDEGGFNKALQEALQTLKGPERAYFFHEYGGMNHQAWYFHAMEKRATCHGLSWVGEAGVFDCLTPEKSRPSEGWPAQVGEDTIKQQQYLDFASHRHFRKSLFMGPKATVAPFSGLKSHRLPEFLIGADIHPTSPGIDLFSKSPASFRKKDGRPLSDGRPLIKAAYQILADSFPLLLPFQSLLEQSRERLKWTAHPNPKQDQSILCEVLLDGFIQGYIHLQAAAPNIPQTPSPTPTLNPFARQLLLDGEDTIIDAFHRRHKIDDRTRNILLLLDGRHSITDLMGKNLPLPNKQPDGRPIGEGKNGYGSILDYCHRGGLLSPSP